jgi:hypothetical protein
VWADLMRDEGAGATVLELIGTGGYRHSLVALASDLLT